MCPVVLWECHVVGRVVLSNFLPFGFVQSLKGNVPLNLVFAFLRGFNFCSLKFMYPRVTEFEPSFDL